MNNETKEIFINDFEANELTLEEKRPSKSKVLYEDTTKRGKAAKHFRLENGNFMAVLYDQPVHKLDPETGEYIDITSETNETEDAFETTMPNFKVRVPKTEGKEKFVAVDKDGREISWKYIPKRASNRKKSIAKVSHRGKETPWEAFDHPSFKYEKADTNIDIQYDVSEEGLKESIVLAKAPNFNTFSFQMKLKGLVACLSDDKKTILLLRNDQNVSSSVPEMIIPPAFMVDDNGIYNENVHYEIRENDGVTFLDIVLDTDWISAPERAFPVVIDPRVDIEAASNIRMVELKSNGSIVNAANRTNSRRIGIDSSGVIHRVYIDFDLPELADSYKITKATLTFHQKDYASNDGSIQSYTVAPVSDPNGKSLSSSAFTWSNVQNLVIGNTIDTFTGEYRSASKEMSIDMTKIVTRWYNDETSFPGIVIKKTNETVFYNNSNSDCNCNYDSNGGCDSGCNGTNTSTSTNKPISMYCDLCSPYAGSDYKPKLCIEYVNADAYSDHQKYHTFENGRAGTGSINLFTGKLSFAHGDVSSEGIKLPLAVSHVYRHEYVDENKYEVNKYGKGWRVSVEQTLEVVDRPEIKAIYTNAQGKRHYFCASEDGSEKITDDAGLGLTYHRECDCFGIQGVADIITDEMGNRMTFRDGKLTHLMDNNGNVNYLKYNDKGHLKEVVDGSKRSVELHYNDQDQLTSITDTNDEKMKYTEYTYNASGELTSITYPSNEGVLKTTFEYDNTHRLTKVIDYTGIAYTISYDNNDKVSTLSCSGTKSVADNRVVTAASEVVDGSISFEYRGQSTAIVDDRTGIKTVHRFDENGRETSSYQDLTEANDNSIKVEATPTEISGYTSIVNMVNSKSNRMSKYRSLSVSLSNDTTAEENLLKNGCFADAIDPLHPSSWNVTGGENGISGVSREHYIDGKHSYFFSNNNKNSVKSIQQTVDLSDVDLDGNILVASAWAKADRYADANSADSSAKFQLVLSINYEDGDFETYTENYDTGCDKWQYAAIPFVLDSTRKLTNVTLKLDYTDNTGTCYFTNARLVAVDGVCTTNKCAKEGFVFEPAYVFDEKKTIKMITEKNDGILTTKDYTDEDSNLVKSEVIDRDGHVFTTWYKYDLRHNLIKTQDSRGLVIEYTYNRYGKELTRKTYHQSKPSEYMFSEMTYEDEQFVKSERDPRYSYNGEELKTEYVRDTDRNLLLKQTSVNGQEYDYTYDTKTDDLITLSSNVSDNENKNSFFYTRGYLTRVAHNGFNFGFGFDELGRSKSVTVGDDAVKTTLLTTNYSKSGNNDITETEYASGEKTKVTTNIFGNPTVSTYTGLDGVEREISRAEYFPSGKLKRMLDNEGGVWYNYTYDNKGNVVKITKTADAGDCSTTGGSVTLSTDTFAFDRNQRLVSKTYGAVGHIYAPIYESNSSGVIYHDNEVVGITLRDKYTDKVEKDGLRRAKSKTFTVGNKTLFSESYAYLKGDKDGDDIETEIVSSVSNHVYGTDANSSTFDYTYDKAGNLESVKSGTSLIAKYYYDGLNRIKREDNYTANKTYVWDYDVGGNITYKKVYALCADAHLGECEETLTYTYKSEGWRDRLDSFNGQTCTYDSMGNPLTYRGNTLTWTKVRRLASYGNNTFTYSANGIRRRKNDTIYTLDGNKILRESSDTRTLTYYYGGSGVIGFNYDGTDYYYRKNLQGDITEIYTSEGAKVASYAYDAWGRVLSVNNITDDNIGDINPFRYRSYYYDVETGLYYLNSRYYDPETGRFINADTTSVLEDAMYDINGLNLYAYCDNNPVAGRDEEGNMSFWKKLAAAVAVVAVVAVAAAVVAPLTGGTALCAVGSVLYGAAKGAIIGAITGAATGAVVGGIQGAVEGYQETGTIEGALRGMADQAVKEAVAGAQEGMLSGMVMGGISYGISAMQGNPMFCFVAGTPVLTVLGKKAIETIKVGDTVPCVDHITGETSEKRVISTTVNKVNRLIELDIDGEIIQCTETHPFQVKGKGWVDACNLTPGDIVYTKDWNTAVVRSINLLELDLPVEVFNFEVEGCHTYFVGNVFILVHNALCHELGKAGEKAAGITKNTEVINMNGTDRIPDGFLENMWVQEVKNVRYQSFTSQLRDYFTYASKNNLKMELYIRQTTNLSKPLQAAIKSYGVILRYFS